MSLAGPHIGFVIAAYAATVIVLVGLAGAIIFNDRAKTRKLETLEARGARRRKPAASFREKQEH